MKKHSILSVILAVVLAAALLCGAACGKKNDTPAPTDGSTVSADGSPSDSAKDATAPENAQTSESAETGNTTAAADTAAACTQLFDLFIKAVESNDRAIFKPAFNPVFASGIDMIMEDEEIDPEEEGVIYSEALFDSFFDELSDAYDRGDYASVQMEYKIEESRDLDMSVPADWDELYEELLELDPDYKAPDVEKVHIDTMDVTITFDSTLEDLKEPRTTEIGVLYVLQNGAWKIACIAPDDML